MKSNYHTHTSYCDGKEPMPHFVERALQLHFKHLGFSSHAPINKENSFSIKEEKINDYIREISALQMKNPQIQLFKGLECDFIPHFTKPFSHFIETYHLDYLIGGVHLVQTPVHEQLWFIDGSKQQTYDEGLKVYFQNNIQKAVTAFWEQTFEMIETQPFDIIAHMDKIKMHNQGRFFSEQENWYVDLIQKAIGLIYDKNIIVEINSRGLYKKRCKDFYPSDLILCLIQKKGIPMVISSDAHKPDELDLYYTEAIEKLKHFGIDQIVHFTNTGWKEVKLP